jgi:hypothetical protein
VNPTARRKTSAKPSTTILSPGFFRTGLTAQTITAPCLFPYRHIAWKQSCRHIKYSYAKQDKKYNEEKRSGLLEKQIKKHYRKSDSNKNMLLKKVNYTVKHH